MFDYREVHDPPPTWTGHAWLRELRELHARGECSDEEYDAARLWYAVVHGGQGEGEGARDG